MSSLKSGWNYTYRFKKYHQLAMTSHLQRLQQLIPSLLEGLDFKIKELSIEENNLVIKVNRDIDSASKMKLFYTIANNINIYDFQMIDSKAFRISI